MRTSSIKTIVTAFSFVTLLATAAPIAEARPAREAQPTRAGAKYEPRFVERVYRAMKRLLAGEPTTNTEQQFLPSPPLPKTNP